MHFLKIQQITLSQVEANAFFANRTNHTLKVLHNFPIDECSPQSKDLTKLWFKDFLITKPIDFLIKSLVFFHLNSKGYPPLQNKGFSLMVQTCNTDSGGTSLAHACRNSGTPCTWDVIFKWVFFLQKILPWEYSKADKAIIFILTVQVGAICLLRDSLDLRRLPHTTYLNICKHF